MKFDQLLLEKLWPIFEPHGFKLSTETAYSVQFKSCKWEISFVYDHHEKSSNIYVGELNSDLLPLDCAAISYLFKKDLIVNFQSYEFITTFSSFFDYQAKPLLLGNLTIIDTLKEFVKTRSKVYTANLVDAQIRAKAMSAWTNRNYGEFISYMTKIDGLKWSEAEKLKYKMAIKRS